MSEDKTNQYPEEERKDYSEKPETEPADEQKEVLAEEKKIPGRVYVLTKTKIVTSAVVLVLAAMLVMSAVFAVITVMRILFVLMQSSAHFRESVEKATTQAEIFTNDQKDRLSIRLSFVGHLADILGLSDEEAVKVCKEKYGFDSLVLLDPELNILYPEEGNMINGNIIDFHETMPDPEEGKFEVGGDFGYLKKLSSGNYVLITEPKDTIAYFENRTVSLGRVIASVSSSDSDSESIAFMKDMETGLYLLAEGYFTEEEMKNPSLGAPSIEIQESGPGSGREDAVCICTYNGRKYFGLMFEENNKQYYYFSNFNSLITSSIYTVLVIGGFFLILAVVSALYLYYCRRYRSRVPYDSTYSEPMIVRRAALIAGAGIAAAGLFVYYTQTLFSLSVSVMDDGAELNQLREKYELSSENARILHEDYENEYTLCASYAAALLADHPELLTKEEFGKLSETLDFDYLVFFDPDGNELVTDGKYLNLRISETEDGLLSDMSLLFKGYPSIYFALPDEINQFHDTNDVQKGIGLPVIGAGNEIKGYLMAVVWPFSEYEAAGSTTLGTIAANEMQKELSSYLIIDPETEMILSLDDGYINQPLSAIGLSAEELSDHYFGKLKVRDILYYATSENIYGLYAYVLSEYSRIYADRLPISLLGSVLYALVISALLYIMRLKRKKYDAVVYGREAEEKEEESLLTMVETGTGTLKSTIAVPYRVQEKNARRGFTPEGRISWLLSILLAITAFVCFIYYSVSIQRHRSTLFVKIIQGDFSRGLNIFAVTRCIFIILTGFVIIFLVRWVLSLVIRITGPRGETICRLFKSTMEYISVIILFYLCLSNLGVDTGTLLASLGLGSLIIGMGARELITDIIAGLFIIFEGDFRVGDVIDLNGYGGMVQEIGLRTTKISGWDKNIKIINNRNLTNVINKTKRNSFAIISFSVNGSVDIEQLEKIFAEEFSDYKEKYPDMLVDNPRFMGIKAFQGGSYECRVIAEVEELKRGTAEYQLSRDIKMILRKNGIPNY